MIVSIRVKNIEFHFFRNIKITYNFSLRNSQNESTATSISSIFMEKHLSIRQREYNFLANRVPTPTLHTSGSHFSVSLKTHRFATAYSRFPGFGIISKSPVLERKVRERETEMENFAILSGKLFEVEREKEGLEAWKPSFEPIYQNYSSAIALRSILAKGGLRTADGRLIPSLELAGDQCRWN